MAFRRPLAAILVAFVALFPLDTAQPNNYVDIYNLLQINNHRDNHTDTPRLEIDQQLKRLAKRCAQYYSENDRYDGSCPGSSRFGQNIYRNYDDSKGSVWAAVKGPETWYAEGRNYNYVAPNTRRIAANFTQLIWRSTKRTGVGYFKANRTGSVGVLVNLFDPPGNIRGRYRDNVRRPKNQTSSTTTAAP